MKDRYIKSGPNKGVHVRIVGRNLEGEPIVQRLDGQALEYPAGKRHHTLDMPASLLSETPPVPTLLEAAKAVVAEWSDIPEAGPFGIDALRAAVEREEAA